MCDVLATPMIVSSSNPITIASSLQNTTSSTLAVPLLPTISRAGTSAGSYSARVVGSGNVVTA